MEDGHIETSTWRQLGKQSPRYNFFLNPYEDTRFTRCPDCRAKTRHHKCTLVVEVQPKYVMIADKESRFCSHCNLLIVHKEELEDLLATHLTMTANPHLIGNDYDVLGTLDREKWDRGRREPFTFDQVIEYLHDFKEVVTFERVSK